LLGLTVVLPELLGINWCQWFQCVGSCLSVHAGQSNVWKSQQLQGSFAWWGQLSALLTLCLLCYICVLAVQIPLPLPRLPYAEAMAKYGSDKPDLRWVLGVERHDSAGCLGRSSPPHVPLLVTSPFCTMPAAPAWIVACHCLLTTLTEGC
jgi:hypothetical protein